jgi:2-polyprenyl-3-methyl-5-hydroxy-6-metoxy-1,4-benzoquinol methylase
LQQLYSFSLYWYIIQRYHNNPTIEQRADCYKKEGRLDYWLQLIQRYGPTHGTVIEVGCAPGILLAELQSRGYKCIGVEPDEKTANWIRQHMKVDVQVGFFPDIDLPNCDLFLAFDVLEHSPSPDRFMQKVSYLLNPGGIAIIQTPIERYGYDPPFGEAFRSAFKEFEHLFLFTNKSIEMLAKYSNLEIIASNERLALHHEICVFKKLCS